MTRTQIISVFSATLFLSLGLTSSTAFADDTAISFRETPGKIQIRAGGKPVATYVYQDDKILRPHFANVHAPGGIPVTRNHPPRAGVDATDHAEMHPGIWLAFGDMGGADFWRNKGSVEHVEFVEKPTIKDGKLEFTVRNRYVNAGRVVCTETCRHELIPISGGYLLTYDSEFRSDSDFSFGDQEEMGLGLRLASPLRVKGGHGRMTAADGKQNESQVRGSTTEWVDYSGDVAGQNVGMTLMPHPKNFRRSWYHARDYGLIVANPFGRNALTGEMKSEVPVKAGDPFRLRFAVYIHAFSSDNKADVKSAYETYIKAAR